VRLLAKTCEAATISLLEILAPFRSWSCAVVSGSIWDCGCCGDKSAGSVGGTCAPISAADTAEVVVDMLREVGVDIAKGSV
jgi:hypothetical protein